MNYLYQIFSVLIGYCKFIVFSFAFSMVFFVKTLAIFLQNLVLKRQFAKNSNNSAITDPMLANGKQPPDLDEVFDQWKRKIDNLFRDINKGGRSPNSKIPSFRMPKSIILIALLVVVVFIWIASGFYTVDANERGVVMQFGKYIETTNPGWHWRLPFPFQSHEIVVFSTVRTFEISGGRKVGAQMLTSDENVIQVQFTVQYDVKDSYKYTFIDLNPEDTTRLAAETAMREVVGNSTMDRVLSESREDVARQVRDTMQIILDRYEVGIRVIRVNLQSVNPPEAVQAAFDDVIKARQDQDRQINEGQAYQQNVVPRARGRASRMSEEALAYKQEVIARAQGEASRFDQLYNEYKIAKQVTRERIYLDTVGQFLGNSKKIIVDPNIRSIINLGDANTKKIIPVIEEVAPFINQQTDNLSKNPNAGQALKELNRRLNR